ncbi:hypothetical protein [Acrocarpospora catenulata]|uniref:hypothetical protein n=1 Tax=Acrocarpospora catenulata TaxID=2836182 RepID=UPI001BDA1D3B|nr:hypothetical protein [Acrocarpospora catenulata]
MSVRAIRLKLLLQQQHWQTYRTFRNEYNRAAVSIDPALAESAPSRSQLFRWLSGDLKGLPYPDTCRVLESMFPGWTAQQLFEVVADESGDIASGKPSGTQSIQSGEFFHSVDPWLTNPGLMTPASAPSNELFGVVDVVQSSSGRLSGVRSHKFIPAYIEASRVAELVRRESGTSADATFGLDCCRLAISNEHGKCALYVWPFGVAMFHLVEELELPNLANLAIWRRKTYTRDLEWASDYLSRSLSAPIRPSYVLSAYWVHAPSWQSHELDTALRIMCIPRVLHERDSEMSEASLAHAELVERSLLSNGFGHTEMASFGFKGISLGYASWSGVVYHPSAPRRALAEEEIVNVELATQSMWTYCEFINTQVEQGKDPQVPDQYGWRFLRGARSRLMNARPQETEYHKSMRTAILETSGTLDRLSEAIEILRETSER